MSGVVTPPPRPPRPYLPAQNRKDGSKSVAKREESGNREPSPGHGRSTDTGSVFQRSYTFSGGSEFPARPQRPVRKQRGGSESSSGRESMSPERPVSPSTKLGGRQAERHTNTRSPLRKSQSQACSQDDLELRRWSYGFESRGNSQYPYRPRAPPPRPPARQLSSPDTNKTTTETMPMQDPQIDLGMPRRSYTFGSAKSLPSYPMNRSRKSSVERETSASPERQLSPGPSSGVDVMGTLIEKSHSAGSFLSKSALPSRPSRPPPPRAKSLPKAASLTAYKTQQDREPEQNRAHSKSTAESQATRQTRPSLSPQRAIDQEQPLTEPAESVPENGGPPNETVAAATAEVPVVPPRPFMPPRPFPPGTQSQGRGKGTRKKHTKHSTVRTVEKTHIQSQSHKERAPSAISSAQVQPVQVKPESKTDELAYGSSDNQEMEKEPPAPEEPRPVVSNKDAVEPLQNTDDLPSESAPVQEQSQAPKSEEPSRTPKQPPSPLKQDLSKVLDEEADQISPLPLSSSPQPRGNKFFSSMKKSFRSLRSPNRKRKQTSTVLGRPSSESDLVVVQKNGKYPDPLPQGIIHPIVVQCVAYLNKESVLKEEGLFRIPGDVAVIKQLRERFVNGYEVDLSEVVDPHTVAGLLKLHFREQRVSMIPRGQTLTSITQAVKDKNVETVRELINSIDVSHIAMLRIVAELLSMVVSFCEENKMSSGTLATSCAPSMFPYLPTSSAVIVMKFLIDHCAEIFQQ